MRWNVVILVTGSLVAAGGASAQGAGERFTGNVTVASDYAFRGISQTGSEPAIQGGMDLTHPSGVYAGAWGSSVNFGEELSAGSRAQMELDVYGGVRKSIPALVDLDLSAVGYLYPGAAGSRHYDYLELGLGASRTIGRVSGGASLRYSPEFFAGSGHAVYYGGQLSVPVSFVRLSASAGHQSVEENATFGTPDYVDYGIGATVGWSGFDFSGKYLGTDLSKADCFGGSTLCEPRFVLGIARAL
jgi:uncharacterized protein (TIGR02001 family)